MRDRIAQALEKKTDLVIRRKWWLDDIVFASLLKKTRGYSLLADDKLYTIYSYCRHALLLNGDLIEVGVYKGGSGRLIAELAKQTEKSIFLFDTFEGFGRIDKRSSDPTRASVYQTTLDVCVDDVRRYLRDFKNVHIVKGIFPNSATDVIGNGSRFCFAHIDVDVYESTMESLQYIYQKVVRSGVIVVDDYGSRKWKGVKTAVDDFLEDKPEICICTTTNQCVVIKRQGFNGLQRQELV